MNYLCDKGVFLLTRLLSNPAALKAIDGHIIRCMDAILINPLMNKMAEQFSIRNVNVKILSNKEDQCVADTSCHGEIILGKPFSAYSGLKVKEFLVDNFE